MVGLMIMHLRVKEVDLTTRPTDHRKTRTILPVIGIVRREIERGIEPEIETGIEIEIEILEIENVRIIEKDSAMTEEIQVLVMIELVCSIEL